MNGSEERLARLEEKVSNLDQAVRQVLQGQNLLRGELHGRPSWAVVTFLGGSMTLNVALIAALIASLHSG